MLNLGAGEPWSHAPTPWIDIDIRPDVLPDVVADVRHLPFRSDSAERVYAGHLLEHVPQEEVAYVLIEIMRVLVPGGAFLAVGPDAERSARLLATGHVSPERHQSNLVTEGGEGNPCLHQWNTSAQLIALMVWQVGFIGIAEIDIANTSPAFPVFDRGSKDQYAVRGWKPHD
jgi:hypothetical protein